MSDNLYPSSPAGADPDNLAISAAFRQQAQKVTGAILLFVIVYLLLIIAAIALAIGCGWLGIALIMRLSNFAVLLVALGIIGVGISVIGFLIKFIFAVARDENSRRMEITEEQQPRLFAFIRRLAKETHTPFPKKIYLSPDVNACVFYNSSFWSMFLPVRKNLEIGLGLVNSINISEFKAVVAHEFGHFSQKSMKLGSFTYNVNRVIYNVLYENKDYTAFLQSWGSIHSYLRFFAGITVKIANGIQWILRGMYQVINKNYLGLSREMEFHADAVAACVSGGNNLISALSRVEVASSCYNTALDDANQQLKEKKISRNIFPNQLTVLHSLAADYYLPVREGLPEISLTFIQSFSRSRINYKDQWASHPTLPERKINLDLLDILAVPDITPAWRLFDHAEVLQETVTRNLYKAASIEESLEPYDEENFRERYLKKKNQQALPAIYNGFYDGRYIDVREWDIDALAAANVTVTGAAATGAGATPVRFENLFSKDNNQLQASIESNKNDMEVLKAIRDKKTPITSFDFDGVKYTVMDCDMLIQRLQDEIKIQADSQKELDKTAFSFFVHCCGVDCAARIICCCKQYKTMCLRYDEYVGLVNRLLTRINPFYDSHISLEEVNRVLALLKAGEEPELKKAFRQLVEDSLLSAEEVEGFLAKNYAYFISGKFLNDELNELTSLALRVVEKLNRRQFECYKSLLEAQLECIGLNSGTGFHTGLDLSTART